ncbi:GNAT family N-acetyltransferase [Clostridium hydrogeniformans]|uniref:GNAT family N-acetyltransferase n=1 Tax=Clostridium hydrogeniformans TaxID=349933 RepID=UPI0004892811|nr:GNAT family protein [Clostridium hydrogeniformans]
MLKGDKVLLKSIERRDIHVFYDIWCDEEVRKYDASSLLLPSKDFLLENFSKFVSGSKKYLSIINEKDVLIGYITYEESGDLTGTYTFGITIGKNFWGRGYGTDAIKTLLKYLFLSKAAHRAELEVVEFNERAIKCYKNCGFKEEGRKRKRYFSAGVYSDVIIMGIIKEEYFELQGIKISI